MFDIDRYEVLALGDIIDKRTNKPVKKFKSNKYIQCCLFDSSGTKHVVGVHSIIARIYCSDWFDGCVVHHIDGNTHNNCATNLMCESRQNHSRMHANVAPLLERIKKYGSPTKGTKLSNETKKRISEAMKMRHDANRNVER